MLAPGLQARRATTSPAAIASRTSSSVPTEVSSSSREAARSLSSRLLVRAVSVDREDHREHRPGPGRALRRDRSAVRSTIFFATPARGRCRSAWWSRRDETAAPVARRHARSAVVHVDAHAAGRRPPPATSPGRRPGIASMAFDTSTSNTSTIWPRSIRRRGHSRLGRRPRVRRVRFDLAAQRAGRFAEQLGDAGRRAVRLERLGEIEQRLDARLELVRLADDVVDASRAPDGRRRPRMPATRAAALMPASGLRIPCATAAETSPIAAKRSAWIELRLGVAQLRVGVRQRLVGARVLDRHRRPGWRASAEGRDPRPSSIDPTLCAQGDEADRPALERDRHDEIAPRAVRSRRRAARRRHALVGHRRCGSAASSCARQRVRRRRGCRRRAALGAPPARVQRIGARRHRAARPSPLSTRIVVVMVVEDVRDDGIDDRAGGRAPRSTRVRWRGSRSARGRTAHRRRPGRGRAGD